MDDRFQETQQSKLDDSELDRVLGRKNATLVKKGRVKRAFVVPFEEYNQLRADSNELRRARMVQAALDDPRPSVPWSKVKAKLEKRIVSLRKRKTRAKT